LRWRWAGLSRFSARRRRPPGAWWRQPAPMPVSPAERKMVMARLRTLAMTRGPLLERTWERSLFRSMLRTRCSRSSISQWPHHAWLTLVLQLAYR
jgi:hypothetical protein